MKRYRILPFVDFDTRSLTLSETINEDWEERIKAMHEQNRANTIARLKEEYGELHSTGKIDNFVALGPKPFSVLAFHNAFFSQVRNAFVIGAYYPALTGACALGERILNHLILALRDDYKNSEQYRKVYRKDSFDDWSVAIETLVAWDVLLPQAAADFRELMKRRHEAIHFRPETDQDSKALALAATKCLQRIIGEQFSGFGSQPWFITSIPGEIYIKKEWEIKPFVRTVYLRNGVLLGPKHKIESMYPQVLLSDPDRMTTSPDISDDEYAALRKAFNDGGQKS